MMTYREAQRQGSNNPLNTNKNVCALRVAEALGVAHSQRYFHNIGDTKRAAATRWSVRSVKTAVKSKTVGGARKAMHDIAAEFFVVHVEGHVLLLDTDGQTIVDTAPRKVDRRKVLGVWGLYPK